ncbi:TetR/AcrR family transcriptional regulator [Halioxenophilus sp. WMMB6]|uniref:TetR/AcrR family transcriptional regulator n=1 Tax=Halioxenophilus sp. WMMB6 TaxID=3073815 RepID=UPI00295E4641|nr:TetR/AcrR family transcriptional regulator [Halioxenophilus sp. WMMB6]
MTESVSEHSSANKRRRNPEQTRESILLVAGKLMAKDGPEGLSVSKVAQLAGVNRGTAYHHFKTREQLVQETMSWVSGKLTKGIFGSPEDPIKLDPHEATEKLARFAMEYPDFARVWLFEIMTSKEPGKDPFWSRFLKNLEYYIGAGLAKPDIDREVYAVIMLVGTVMWPVWARAKTSDKKELEQLTQRFIKEVMRLSLHGSLIPEKFSNLDEASEYLKEVK